MWVKGSGGDLGTLTEAGLAVLRLDRLRALADVYPGVEREDEMVAAFDYCLHGRGGAAPSIDTAIACPGRRTARRPPAPRLRDRPGHRRRRRGADPGVLRRPGGVGAVAAAGVPARPGHGAGASGEPAGDRRHPRRARHHRLGADQRRVRGEQPGDHLHRRSGSSTSVARPSRSARSWRGCEPCPTAERRARAAALAPVIRGLASTDAPQVGHFTDTDGGAGLLLPGQARARWRRWAPPARTTSCAPRSRPMVLDLPAAAPVEEVDRAAEGAARDYRAGLRRLLRPARHADLARRCAAPTRRSCWCPGWACSPSARTPRPRGWPGSSTSTRST